MGETCLNRLLGYCKNCKEDYDPFHHPNNTDCRSYQKVTLLEVTVIKLTLLDQTKITIGKLFGKNGEYSSKIIEQRAKQLETI
jgi:hypothetical protein